MVGAAVGAALVLTASACTPTTPTPSLTTSTTSSAPGPTPTATPTATPEALSPTVSDRLAEWTTIAGPSQELSTFAGLSDGSFLAILGGDDQTVAVFTDGHRQEVPAPHGYVVQDVLQVGGKVVFGAVDESNEVFRLYRWTPGEPSADVLLESSGSDAYWPETAVWGDDLYVTAVAGDTMCVTRWDVTSADPATTAQPVACGGPRESLSWVSAQDGALSYLLVGPDGGCSRLMTVSLPDGQPEPVATDGCVGRAVASTDLAAWDQIPESSSDRPQDWFDVPVLARAGDQFVSLGRATGGSEMICDGALYWLTAFVSGTPQEIRRWAPGGDIEVVYRSPDEDRLNVFATSKPICGKGMLGLQRIGWWADSGEEFLATGTWTWIADVTPAASRPAAG